MLNHENPQKWRLLVAILKNSAAQKKISHQAIADQTGMLRSSVGRILSGKFIPTLDTFIRIAQGIGINFFIEDQDSTTDLNQAFEAAMKELDRR